MIKKSGRGVARSWTEQEIERFEEMYFGQFTLKEIYEEFNTSLHTVNILLDRLGIPKLSLIHI